MPKISIITACFNSEPSIERTILSVLENKLEELEYIVVDGGSTDSTLEIIRRYDQIDIVVSEPDEGIADAWNKGIGLATGEIIGFLNADDLYGPQTLSAVSNIFSNLSDSEKKSTIFYGVCVNTRKGSVRAVNRACFDKERLKWGFGFTHTTCFVPKVIYDSIGGFNTSYKIAIDTDFLLRAYKTGVTFVQGDYRVYMEDGGVSDAYAKKAYSEYQRSLIEHEIVPDLDISKCKLIYSLYCPMRKYIKSRGLNIALRKLKHYLVYLMNVLFQLIPTMSLKRWYLSGVVSINIPASSHILRGAKFYTRGNVSIGEGTIINSDCLIDNRASVKIGNGVSIAHHVKFYTGGHDIQAPYFDYFSKPVSIEDNVCIFAGAVVQPGVTIGVGAVILPGAVVTQSVEPYSICGGVPAKVINRRSKGLHYKFDYPFWYAN